MKLIVLKVVTAYDISVKLLMCVLDHGVFNVALQTLLDRDRKKCPHLKVPLILQEVRLCVYFCV